MRSQKIMAASRGNLPSTSCDGADLIGLWKMEMVGSGLILGGV